jgi:mRNA interferase MazF
MKMNHPQRGEISLVNVAPTIGQEIKKTRPTVVISSDLFSFIAIRIITALFFLAEPQI